MFNYIPTGPRDYDDDEGHDDDDNVMSHGSDQKRICSDEEKQAQSQSLMALLSVDHRIYDYYDVKSSATAPSSKPFKAITPSRLKMLLEGPASDEDVDDDSSGDNKDNETRDIVAPASGDEKKGAVSPSTPTIPSSSSSSSVPAAAPLVAAAVVHERWSHGVLRRLTIAQNHTSLLTHWSCPHLESFGLTMTSYSPYTTSYQWPLLIISTISLLHHRHHRDHRHRRRQWQQWQRMVSVIVV